MSSLVEPTYYAGRTGQTLASGQEVLLEEASELIRANAPGVEARIGTDISEVRVMGIVCDVVFRYLANPALASQVGDGPFLTSWSGINARGMFLTADEATELNATSTPGRPSGFGSIRLSVPVRPRRGCW